jgi:broad specificity phosphatase PhoE
MREARRRLLLAGLALAAAPFARADETGAASLWRKLRSGNYVLLVRHAATEGGAADPPGFSLADCSTQRELSAEGREQARALGERIRAEKVPIAKVFTSPWCRCRDTATIAFGRAEEWDALASVFEYPDREREYTEKVKKRVGTYAWHKPGGNVVMVTHNVNIAALTKLSIDPAEVVVVRPDGCCGLRTVGRLKA